MSFWLIRSAMLVAFTEPPYWMRTATAAELMQPNNLRSMMIYAMSGGNPETLRTLTHRMHVEERDGRIIAGILSYLNGATKTAALTLKDV